jgi:hypothetical protein
MTLIFLAYRRGDSKWITGRIFDRLAAHFGRRRVFMDMETIPPGVDFRQHIESALERCQLLVAVVGPQWTGSVGLDQPRIFDEEDFVRIEIETALKKKIPIIPVTIDGAPLPKAGDLPASLRPFAYLNASEVNSNRNFDVDTKRLVRAIAQRLGWRSTFKRYGLTAAIILAALLVGLFFAYQWLTVENTRSETDRREAAIQACNIAFTLTCAQQGGAFGADQTLAGLKSCTGGSTLIRSDEPPLHWKDVWTTSVYSYAPGGGGPGGGADDDVLKVGGWGDWYFSLIQFDLPRLLRRPKFAAIALYSKESEGASVPLALDRIIHRWDFPKGDRLWWKDRPGHRAITTDPLPAPKKEQWYVVEITSLVQEWLDGKSENYGVQIRPIHDFGSFVFFVSSDAVEKSKIPRLIFCA